MFKKLLEIVDDDNPKIVLKDNNIEFNVQVTCNNIKIESINFYENLINYFDFGDQFILNISTQYSDKAILCNKNSISDFLNKLNINILLNKEDDEYCKLEIIISKTILNGAINIYCLDKFIEFIYELTVIEQLKFFNNKRKDGITKFIVRDSDKSLVTNTFSFINIINNNVGAIVDRDLIIKNRNLNCSFIGGNEHDFIPEDFKISSSNCEKLTDIFKRLSLISSLSFICNTTVLENNNLVNSRIIGYKSIIFNVTKETKITEQLCDEIYKIYEWIYSNVNISDKIGLARNVISLGINENLELVSDNLFESVKSSHEIYLKENIKQYIEIKNKISEFIFEFNQNNTKLANSIGTALSKNYFAAITFYCTIILAKIIDANKEVKSLFTKEVSYISAGFILGCIIYMMISIIQTWVEYQRYKVLYYRVKNNYDDILNRDDIEKIFKNDKVLKEDTKYIRNKSIFYCVFWIITLVIMSTITYNLGYEYLNPLLKKQ